MASKTSKRTPGVSCYNQPRERCGWYWTAWQRSLKIGPTSQPQDIARCYEAMTRGIYAVNLKRKEEGMRDAWGPRAEVKPTCYENLLLPRHTPKKNSRGSPKVGRQKTSVTGIRIFKRKNTVTETASSVRQDEVNQASKSTCSGGEKFGYTQPSISAPTASKSQKHVRFDEDSEWMDISDEEVLDFLEGEEDSGIFMLDDEYVLL